MVSNNCLMFMLILILIFLPIELTPNLTSLWVKGIEKFFFTVTEETNFIVFHSTGIDISSRTINERLKVRINMRLQKIRTVHLKKINFTGKKLISLLLLIVFL